MGPSGGSPRRRRYGRPAVSHLASPAPGCGLQLDLIDRAEVREAAAARTGRINSVVTRTDRVDVDALLTRPDGCVACAPAPPGRTSTPPCWCVRRAPGSTNQPEAGRINVRLRFAR
ncbi:hypothetical protein ABZ825_37875 [Streptomyces tauricus]|uniref:aromatic-ring hydroxylase C-terminal domain-containing protein n=1 Tax=Streptomyces tauricus TaxID=68274 RepID=UPI0033DCC277